MRRQFGNARVFDGYGWLWRAIKHSMCVLLVATDQFVACEYVICMMFLFFPLGDG